MLLPCPITKLFTNNPLKLCPLYTIICLQDYTSYVERIGAVPTVFTMQDSTKNLAKAILSGLAVLCVVLIIIFVFKNKPSKDADPNQMNNVSNYGFTTSQSDFQSDDDSTLEMDSIPSNADAPIMADEEA